MQFFAGPTYPTVCVIAPRVYPCLGVHTTRGASTLTVSVLAFLRARAGAETRPNPRRAPRFIPPRYFLINGAQNEGRGGTGGEGGAWSQTL